MAHLVLIEDSAGELTDINYYCSDYCAQEDELYDGWYGAAELEVGVACFACGKWIEGTEDDYPPALTTLDL